MIVASNQPLKKLVADGKFREDLYFRLSGQRIELAPLRDRKEDIPELAKNFLDQERPRRNKQFTEDGLEALQDYNWPGNVRELKRVCEQISLTSPLPFISRGRRGCLIKSDQYQTSSSENQSRRNDR